MQPKLPASGVTRAYWVKVTDLGRGKEVLFSVKTGSEFSITGLAYTQPRLNPWK